MLPATALGRLGAYAALLAILAGIAAGLGYAVGPLAEATEAEHSNLAEPGATHEGGMGSEESETVGGLALSASGYRLVLDQATFPLGSSTPLRFRIVGRDGVPVREFDREGGVRMHVIVARRDLTGYQHLHPRLLPSGSWTTELTLADSGVYRVFADFERDGVKTVLGGDVFVAGRFVPTPLRAADTAEDAEGYEVQLAGEARAGQETELVFRVRRGLEPVALEPYLGARGHLVALRRGDLAYLHVHPLAQRERGEIMFAATFPTPGTYRLFLQFKDGDRVRMAPFTLEVRR